MRRSTRLHEIALHHSSEEANGHVQYSGGACRPINRRGAVVTDEMNSWRSQMAVKYRAAARHPWLPVAADPPEPK